VIAVAVASHPGLVTRHLLGNLPMRWLGQRSYSIYLWHWPVFMLTRPQLDVGLSGLPLLGLRMSLTMALAVGSYALIEKPVRDGALGRAWAGLRSGVSSRSLGKTATGFACLGLPVILCGTVIATAAIPRSAPEPPAEAILAGAGEFSAGADPLPTIEDLDLTLTAPPEELTAAPPTEPAAPPAPPAKVTAIGDSVMLIAKDALAARFGGGLVDAGIGRQSRTVIQTVQEIKDRGELGDGVIIHMGTNGLITVKQFEQLMDILKDVPRVSVVNVKVARPWEEINNRMLAENIGRFPNARLVDWKATATAHPEAFYNDGVHLKPSGVGIYVDLLSNSITG
ncbi:MAG: acyltransferase family protein, partial [Actinomycetota bacterium]